MARIRGRILRWALPRALAIAGVEAIRMSRDREEWLTGWNAGFDEAWAQKLDVDDLTTALLYRFGGVQTGAHRPRAEWELDARYILGFIESLAEQRAARG